LAKQINSRVIFDVFAALTSLFAASFITYKLSLLTARQLCQNAKAITAKLFGLGK
jgi:hypothetical protein